MQRITVDEYVDCPVANCGNRVIRRRRGGELESAQFLCAKHRIYISPSTFMYADQADNLLWTDQDSTRLLSKIKAHKREWRMAHECSEDAMTWNVFRYLQRSGRLREWLNATLGLVTSELDLIYWGTSTETEKFWQPLNDARRVFGERVSQGTEPDLIVMTPSDVVFLELKTGSGHQTKPSGLNSRQDPDNQETPSKLRKYESAQDQYFRTCFTQDVNTICVDNRNYELMRLMLLGSWLANDLGRRFTLATITPRRCNPEPLRTFRASLHSSKVPGLQACEWEKTVEFIAAGPTATQETQIVTHYLNNVTGGYLNGKLVRVFSSA